VLPRALAAYRDLNRAAAAAVAPGGLLVTASCSSHVTPAAFAAVVAEALADRPRARVLESRGAGADHPVLPAFPEGRYLKLLIVAL
jgi:23S rRNA (cytosine1962-C5)-methyltransferase